MAAIAWRLPPDTTVAARLSRDRLLGGSLVEWRVVAVTMALFLCSFGYGGIMSFVAVMSDQHGITPRSLFFTAFALTVLVTRVFSGRLADRVGHRRFLLPCLALVTVGLTATALAQTRLQLVLAAAVFGLGFGNQYPAFVGHVLKFVDPSRRGAAFGGILAAFDTGIGTGSIAVGWMAEHVGLRVAFGVGALLSAFSIPYFLWAEKRFLGRAAVRPRSAHRVEDRELLPDLAREAGRQVLDLVHGLERHRVVEVLHVEGRHLAGERQRLGAVVEVARQLEAAHRARGQDAGLRPRSSTHSGSFVSWCMSITWAIERSSWMAWRARRRLRRVSSVTRKKTADAPRRRRSLTPGLDAPARARQGQRLDGSAQRGHGDGEAGEDEDHEEPRPRPAGAGSGGRSRPLVSAARSAMRVELAADPGETRRREAHLDALAEQLDRAGDRGGVEAAVGAL